MPNEPKYLAVSHRQVQLLNETRNIDDATGQADSLALKLALFEYNLNEYIDLRLKEFKAGPYDELPEFAFDDDSAPYAYEELKAKLDNGDFNA